MTWCCRARGMCWTELSPYIRLVRNPQRETDVFVLRAESFCQVAEELDRMARAEGKSGFRAYGGRLLHGQSHGESFVATVQNRFVGHRLYLLDEPESALSSGTFAMDRGHPFTN